MWKFRDFRAYGYDIWSSNAHACIEWDSLLLSKTQTLNSARNRTIVHLKKWKSKNCSVENPGGTLWRKIGITSEGIPGKTQQKSRFHKKSCKQLCDKSRKTFGSNRRKKYSGTSERNSENCRGCFLVFNRLWAQTHPGKTLEAGRPTCGTCTRNDEKVNIREGARRRKSWWVLILVEVSRGGKGSNTSLEDRKELNWSRWTPKARD